MEPFSPSAIGTMMYFRLVAWQSASGPLLFFLYTNGPLDLWVGAFFILVQFFSAL
ncbi:rCG44487 [Rattus norvegicus]|uniref:RCG44487 n=1 Tax=Rattus norvegicus TaxID=10116 RepID=A6I5N6_RAT|nr:rCG44487 [Rattus norvegicus]